jgi:hypothetical protein
VPVGTVVQGEDQIRLRAEQGCRFLLVGNDTGMFGTAARQITSTTRSALAAPPADEED